MHHYLLAAVCEWASPPQRSRIRSTVKENVAQLVRRLFLLISFHFSGSLPFPRLSRHTRADGVRPAGT